jgi:uncharacterized DUF497 family protein
MIRWNEEKNRWLVAKRGISFQEIAERILAGDYIDLLENPARPGQDIVVLTIQGYTWVVPFLVEEEDTLFLKTAYPSRKFHRRYGGRNGEQDGSRPSREGR